MPPRISQRYLSRILAALAAAFVGAVCVACSGEQDSSGDLAEFPRKPIKVIVPFGPGGDSDTFARLVQKTVRDHDLLDEPLVILNVPGAGGTVGSRSVRDAAPDGYKILNLHEGIYTSKYSGRATYGPEAFRPIAATAESSLVICVRDDSPYQDLADLMGAVVQSPDTILFGMAQGTPTHFAGRRLENAAGDGARFRMVASGGGAKRRNDLVGEHVDVTPFSLAEYIGFQAGGVRAIAYLAAERHPDLPDVPTARELGFDVVMHHVHYWWAPRATPDLAVERIADMLEAAMATDYLRGRLAETKTEPLFLRGAALESHLAARDLEFQDVALVHYGGLPDPVVPVLVITGILAVAILLGARRSGRLGAGNWQHGLAVLAVLSIYLLAMQLAHVPYPWATMALIPALAIVCGARSPAAIARITAIGTAVAWSCFFIFTRILVIDLP